MLKRSSADPVAARSPDLPSLGDLDYRVQGLLPTDSKMSEILLATDRRNQKVILKIACVQQRARAEANRRAIHNSVAWLQGLRDHTGIAQMQPIQRKGHRGLRAWFAEPTFVGTLPAWPDKPDFLVTEYLGGGTLHTFVGKRRLPIALALTLAYDLAQTLAYLHAHQCVHRDLKPENILFRGLPTPTAKPGTIQPVLIDFGVAAHIGEPKLISGSRLWMAPELQDAHEKVLLPVDPAWDVYALGLICCYMLSGQRPWRRQYSYQDYIDYRIHIFARLQQAIPSTDAAGQQIVADLQQILDRALAREPHQRPTAAEFAAGLARLVEQLGIAPPRRVAGLPQWRGQLAARLRDLPRRWAWGALAILVVLLISLLAAVIDRGQPLQAVASEPLQSAVAATEWTVLSGAIASPGPDTAHGALLPVKAEPATVVQLPAAHTATRLPPTLTRIIPTLAARSQPLLTPPPTLMLFTPTLIPTLMPTLMPTVTPLPTITATASSTRPPPTVTAPAPVIVLVSVTPTRQPTPILGTIQLIAPASGLVAAQERVEFSWQIVGAALDPEHCYELVFWDPNKVHDKRSPVGAGRGETGTVAFSKLSESPDPLLRGLARSQQGFDWGVRLVACRTPQTIVQDVSETRHYTYQP